MNGTALVVMILLLVMNGFFVAVEFAFTAASPHALSSRTSRSAAAAVAAIEDLSFTLAGAQLGITVASLLLGFVAEPAVAAILESLLEFANIPDQLLHTISFIVSLSIVVFLHMVIGEMAPKNVAISDPERFSLFLSIPFRIYATVLRPVIWLLNELANLGLRAVRIDPGEVGDVHTADDLAVMITAGRRSGVVEEFAHRLLTGAIDLAELEATHVMVPRPDIVAVPLSITYRQLEQVVKEVGHSRIPVYAETLDDIRGFIHAKDLLRLSPADYDQPVPEAMIRRALVVPESARVDRLLQDMRRRRSHLAIVIDEHGGTAGLVTMEDIVEEVVGEIRDEHDVEADGVRRVSANRWLVDASLRPSEVRRATGVNLPEGEYDTVSGLVMERIGRIPLAGDRIDDEAWTLRVRSMEGRRVGDVDLIVKPRRRRDE